VVQWILLSISLEIGGFNPPVEKEFMMQRKRILFLTALLGVIIIGAFFTYKKFFHKKASLPYTTQKPERKTIKRIIDTTGKIRIAEKIKIGSLVAGTIKKLYVDENEFVKKGQLLALIDTGKGDADVREAKGSLQQAKARYDYQKAYYKRQKALHRAGQLSQNEFDEVIRDYLSSHGNYQSSQARFDRAKEAYDNTQIFSPQEGVIIKVGVAEGQRITTELDATVLFEIARDITRMEAILRVDESSISQIIVGQKVEFTVDTLPHKLFTTTVSQIAYSPKEAAGDVYYKTSAPVDNSEKLLRPGLSVDAKIFIAKSKNALTIPSQAFMISPKVLQAIAKKIGYSYHSIDKKEVKTRKAQEEKPIDTVWIVQKNGEGEGGFIEKIVVTNLTDDIHFEVVSGLTENDDVIINIEEKNYMEEIYKKAYSGSF